MRLTKRGIVLLSCWLLIAIGNAIWQLVNFENTHQLTENWLESAWWVFAVLITALFIFEVFSFAGFKKIIIKRTIAQTIPVNSYVDVNLEIENPLTKKLQASVLEHLPEFCDYKSMPATIKFAGNQTATICYQLKSFERGNLEIKHCEFWVLSDFGLIRRRYLFEYKTISKVYPNYRSIMNYTLLATEQKTRQLGIRQRQQRGDGLEFHQLREYRVGDSLRQIDWRATSRLQKIISKDYQQERDQNIIFLLDAGRRMRTKDGKLSHFDQALNATLLVSSIALRQGDAVGLKVFGGTERFLLPKKGQSSISAMLNNVYDVHPKSEASDLIVAAESLNKQFKKRSLVVIVSNIRSEDKKELVTAVNLLKKHHLVMLANLKEQAFHQVFDEPIFQLNQALKYAQSSHYLQEREKLHASLVHDGVIAVDSLPNHLAVNMVNQYFDIKRSGRL